MARVAKLRYAMESGYARGEQTRARIVAAALKLFGQVGFAGASTRDIAALAGVNAPALRYYFDTKEGLFVACVEQSVKSLLEWMSEVLETGARLVAEQADVDELTEVYCDIQARLAQFMFTATGCEEWRWFMARIQRGEGPAAGFELLR
jgi:TetR/AcrR family transcriptional regulator, regulator of cefoperazone and chloramphenicol sensitivity